MSVNFYTGANNITVKNTLTDELKTSYDEAVELVNKLGSDATVEGSVAQRLAAIVANAPEKYDTLKEIATWIESDTDGAAKMQADISTLEADKLDKTSVSSWAKASTKPMYTASEINMTDGTSVENAVGTLNANTIKSFYSAILLKDELHTFNIYGQLLFVASQGGNVGFCVVLINATAWRTDFVKIADTLTYPITFEGKSSDGTFIPWTATWDTSDYEVRIYKL